MSFFYIEIFDDSYQLISYAKLVKNIFENVNDFLTFILYKNFFIPITMEVMASIKTKKMHSQHYMVYKFRNVNNTITSTKNICNTYKELLNVYKCQKWFFKFKSGNLDLAREGHYRIMMFCLKQLKLIPVKQLKNSPRSLIQSSQ
uniref:HTH_48 domain-containing protein n=1 Tax=Strongyloides stercoralis TaxID=6248 RepID=A0A0K0DXP1_STRER